MVCPKKHEIEEVQIRMIAQSGETFVILLEPSEENYLEARKVAQLWALRSALYPAKPRFRVGDYMTMLHTINVSRYHWKRLTGGK